MSRFHLGDNVLDITSLKPGKYTFYKAVHAWVKYGFPNYSPVMPQKATMLFLIKQEAEAFLSERKQRFGTANEDTFNVSAQKVEVYFEEGERKWCEGTRPEPIAFAM